MARKKSSSRTTLSYILSLLIAIFLSILVVLTVTRFTVMSPSFLISKMDGADFYKQSVVSLNEEIQQETQSTGFPIEMFENYVDEDTAKTAMEKYINNAFDGGETTISTTEFETKLTQDIDNYLNIIINSESQEAISVLKSNLIDLYKSYLSFPYLALVIDVINTYDGIFLIAAAALVVLIGLASFLLYRLYSHYQGRRRYFSYALSASGLMCFALPFFIYIGKFIDKISLSPAYFYNFFTSTLNSYMLTFVIVGLVMIVLANIVAYIKFERK
mgnify:CR=1 FL=1